MKNVRSQDAPLNDVAKSDVNFLKMHNPTNPAPKFAGKSRLGDYSDSMLELDDNIGRVMAAIRAEAPNTIVIVTADFPATQRFGRFRSEAVLHRPA